MVLVVPDSSRHFSWVGAIADLHLICPESLQRHLPAYRILDDLDDIPQNLRGLHQDNPVNAVEHAGVQLELPPRVRGSSPFVVGLGRPGLTPHTESLIDALVECSTTWQQ